MEWNEGQEWNWIYDKAIFSSFYCQFDVLLSLQLVFVRRVKHFCVLLQYICQIDTDQNANSLNMTHTTGSPFKQNMIGGCTNNVHSIMWQMCQVLPKIVSFSRLFLEIILLHCAWWATTTKVETRTGWNHFGNNSFREHFSAKLGGRLCGKEVSKHTWTHKMILNVMSRTLAQYFPDRWSTHSFIASGKGFGFKHSVG